MLSNTPDIPFTESNLPERKGLELYLQLQKTTEFILKIWKILLSKSLLTTDAVRKSLQQQDLSAYLSLLDQHLVPSLSEAQLRQAMLVVPKSF